jgi:SAM-dependent methyltransferase
MSAADATSRFSNRVADYIRHRPGYPPAVLDMLRAEAGLTPDLAIGDVGSGTGISAELFLKAGHTVYGVEPNREMREAAESLLTRYPNFHSVAGTAEATTLPDNSMGAVVAGQAFHWFDAAKARAEFRRILRPPKLVVLLWNTRKLDTTPFLRAYEALLQRFGTDYKEVVHTNVDRAALRAFFGGDFAARVFPNEQVFDRDGARGRLLSSSYVPPPGHPSHDLMLREFDRSFDAFAEGGRVRFEYDTEVYFGRLT